MSSMTTSKPINLTQLVAEVGTNLTMTEAGSVRTIEGDVAQDRLEAAVAAHVAVDAATIEANRTAVEEALETAITSLRGTQDVARVIAAKANAEVGPRDTKDLARELVTTARIVLRLCRAVTGRYDATD